MHGRSTIVATAVTAALLLAGAVVQEKRDPADLSDAEWRERLTAAEEGSRWYVGARFGMALSGLPGDRALRILKACWPEIATSVRKQILKGFTPAVRKKPDINPHFFDVMHLGMTDPDGGVRQFATTYVQQITFNDFGGDMEAYGRWYAGTRGRAAEVVIVERCREFLQDAHELGPDDVPAALDRIAEAANNLREFTAMREAALDAGMYEIIDQWIDDGIISRNDPKVMHLAGNVRRPAKPGDDRDALERDLEDLVESWAKMAAGSRDPAFNLLVRAVAGHQDPRAIPVLIGMIDADNSYDTIYGVGYFGLGRITGVEYSAFHDGAWWRRWWEKNKSRFPPQVQGAAIPDLPKSDAGREHVPFPDDLDTLDGKLRYLDRQLESGGELNLINISREIARHGDARAIPAFIALIEADDTYDTVYGVGHFGLAPITGVKYDESHNGAWWRDWWQTNRNRFPQDTAEQEIPDLRERFKAWKGANAAREAERSATALAAEFAGLPAQDLTAPDHQRMRYFLIGPRAGDDEPPEGYGLVVILPGGDGSADFNPFCKRIVKNALPPGYVGAQLVAPVWNTDPNRRVWPTRQQHTDAAEFTTEDFINSVVTDVGRRIKVDYRLVFTLGWSSGGPPLYSMSLQPDSVVTGTFIAMSVFKPQTLPALLAAKGRVYYILHSPEDWISFDRFPKVAEQSLREHGAKVKLATYRGGHGWTEDPYGNIRRGLEWLAEQQASP